MKRKRLLSQVVLTFLIGIIAILATNDGWVKLGAGILSAVCGIAILDIMCYPQNWKEDNEF